MATVALTASATELDAGTAYDLTVLNTGASAVRVQVGSVFDQQLGPGRSVVVHPQGQSVTAFAASGEGEVETTVAANPQPAPSGGTSVASGPLVQLSLSADVTGGDGNAQVLSIAGTLEAGWTLVDSGDLVSAASTALLLPAGTYSVRASIYPNSDIEADGSFQLTVTLESSVDTPVTPDTGPLGDYGNWNANSPTSGVYVVNGTTDFLIFTANTVLVDANDIAGDLFVQRIA